MASVIKNLEYIKHHFNDHSDFILEKIDKEKISISQKSTKFVSEIAYVISNYSDFINGGTYSGMMEITISEMKNIYNQWFDSMSKNYPEKDYIEKNDILFDYRINGVGFYWVDLKSHYSHEMAVRLNNCGRVNTYQNLIELREYDQFGLNFSRVFVVIDKNGVINQIRGYNNTKPEKKYFNLIYNFFMEYHKINGFNFLAGKNNDLTLYDLPADKIEYLKEKRPDLFKMSLL
jgi:hypothetical protein